MVFSSIEFLYYFLPCTLLLYFIVPAPGGSTRYKNLVLLATSLVFYAWGEPVYVCLMAAQCVLGWFFGLRISKAGTHKKALAAISVAITLSCLLVFKYADFFIRNLNAATGRDVPLLHLALPVGISFYTFQIISYTIDLYRGHVYAQSSLLAFSTYVALFPQLIAGPIVRYADVAKDLETRQHSISSFALGARRFILGLAKKVLLANLMGELVDIYRKSGAKSSLFTWLYLAAYTLHVYFDFSGYSDMAIGLGHIFGFRFPENFHYPYTAASITDFWRRWHMSLSSWFRDYVYIPLGGNRVSPARHVGNIMAVWMLTGFWHGADWNFVFWGLFFGLLLLAEKWFLGAFLAKAPRPVRSIYVLLALCIGWTIFDGQSLSDTLAILRSAFFLGTERFPSLDALYYLRSYAVPLCIGAIGCTPLPAKAAAKLSGCKGYAIIEALVLGILLLISTGFIVDGSFNPFIYFRF